MNVVTKSELFTRAWQIRRNQPYRKFASCLSIAWGEAKRARFYNWLHLPLELRYLDPLQSIKDIKQAMFLLQMKTRMGPAGFAQMDAYAQEIRQLEDMMASEPLEATCQPCLTECE